MRGLTRGGGCKHKGDREYFREWWFRGSAAQERKGPKLLLDVSSGRGGFSSELREDFWGTHRNIVSLIGGGISYRERSKKKTNE